MIKVPESLEEQKECWKKYPVKIVFTSNVNEQGQDFSQSVDLAYIDHEDGLTFNLMDLTIVASKVVETMKAAVKEQFGVDINLNWDEINMTVICGQSDKYENTI